MPLAAGIPSLAARLQRNVADAGPLIYTVSNGRAFGKPAWQQQMIEQLDLQSSVWERGRPKRRAKGVES